jgi:hypothetical protein
MKKIDFSIGKKIVEKKNPEVLLKNTKIFDFDIQKCMINQLFLEENFPEKKIMKCELQKKLNSYKQQDITKKKHNLHLLISLEEIIEKLVISKLKCYYCKHDLYIFYKNIRESYQWTLDRINNDIGHYTDNVVISCLECNLKRRRTNADAFLFTKQLRIKKV